ncbi:MAG: type IX secretion system protein PorQ [Saprospiraceae bacterium]|nr:type IX secretion system protein PorQ [Saprospiraceae bacterium]
MSRCTIITILVLFLSGFNWILAQQTGGRSAYQFLNLSASARNTALGSYAISWASTDPALAYHNPSLIQHSNQYGLSFQHQSLPGGLKNGHFAYCHAPFKNGIQLQAGVHFLNTSDIQASDIFGNNTGYFGVGENAFYIGASKKLNERIHFGLNLQFVSSNLEMYSSHALAFNGGIHYFNPIQRFALSLVMRNAGFALNSYHLTKENLPFVAEIGFSKRLKHLPFIYHIGFHHLHHYSVRYDDPALRNSGSLFGTVKEPSAFARITDNFFRHFAFGGEMLLGKKEIIALRIGYNHLRRKELGIKDYSSFAGLSFGAGLKIYKFRIDYTYAIYHLGGGVNQFGLTTQINSFLKQKEL